MMRETWRRKSNRGWHQGWEGKCVPKRHTGTGFSLRQLPSPASSPTHTQQSTNPSFTGLIGFFFPISRHPGSRYSKQFKGLPCREASEQKAQYTANTRTEATRGTNVGKLLSGQTYCPWKMSARSHFLQIIYRKFVFHHMCLERCLVVQNTDCFSTGPGFNSQHHEL